MFVIHSGRGELHVLVRTAPDGQAPQMQQHYEGRGTGLGCAWGGLA
jgi:hypothetical protein